MGVIRLKSQVNIHKKNGRNIKGGDTQIDEESVVMLNKQKRRESVVLTQSMKNKKGDEEKFELPTISRWGLNASEFMNINLIL